MEEIIVDGIAFQEEDILNMMNDTSKFIAKQKAGTLGSATTACQQTNMLTQDVEFWKWMGANYKMILGQQKLLDKQHSKSHNGQKYSFKVKDMNGTL